MRITVAILNKKGSNAVPTVVQALETLKLEDRRFALGSPSALFEAEDIRVLREKSISSPVVVGCVFSKTLTREEPQFTLVEDGVSMFEGRLYSSASRLLPAPRRDPKKQPTHEETMKNFVKKAEGDFSLIIAENERILAARDPIGVQPLYYGENADLAVLASNRTALWKLGMSETYSFPPGNLAVVNNEGFRFKPVRTLGSSKPRRTTMSEATQTLQKLLERSVRVRVRDVKEVAVAFSGGLDSSVVGLLAKTCRVGVHLVHVSLRGQPETEDARKAAEELKLPLSVYLFEDEDVERTAAKVVELIEEPDPVKVAVGIPFFWVAKRTAESGLDVLLAGQGADELFGGYRRYVNEYLSHGKNKVRETMFADVVRLHENNIERDKKICGFHDVELRLPFASYNVAKFALSLPVELKIERKEDGLRKLVLRRMALNIGLPKAVVNKPKKAVQYATGVNAVLGKIAKKQDMAVKEFVEKIFLKGQVDR